MAWEKEIFSKWQSVTLKTKNLENPSGKMSCAPTFYTHRSVESSTNMADAGIR